MAAGGGGGGGARGRRCPLRTWGRLPPFPADKFPRGRSQTFSAVAGPVKLRGGRPGPAPGSVPVAGGSGTPGPGGVEAPGGGRAGGPRRERPGVGWPEGRGRAGDRSGRRAASGVARTWCILFPERSRGLGRDRDGGESRGSPTGRTRSLGTVCRRWAAARRWLSRVCKSGFTATEGKGHGRAEMNGMGDSVGPRLPGPTSRFLSRRCPRPPGVRTPRWFHGRVSVWESGQGLLCLLLPC